MTLPGEDRKEKIMEMSETRVAQIGIVVDDPDSVESLNALLHLYGEYIIGRMGIPYHRRGVNIISVVIDAPTGIISELTGRIGMLDGVSSSAVFAKLPTK
jgi:putative iron-only hydrogenase system regulator